MHRHITCGRRCFNDVFRVGLHAETIPSQVRRYLPEPTNSPKLRHKMPARKKRQLERVTHSEASRRRLRINPGMRQFPKTPFGDLKQVRTGENIGQQVSSVGHAESHSDCASCGLFRFHRPRNGQAVRIANRFVNLRCSLGPKACGCENGTKQNRGSHVHFYPAVAQGIIETRGVYHRGPPMSMSLSWGTLSWAVSL